MARIRHVNLPYDWGVAYTAAVLFPFISMSIDFRLRRARAPRAGRAA